MCVLGDFNANLRCNSNCLFGNELLAFCKAEHFVIADTELCSNDSFTFFSEAHNSVSWLDHVIVSKSAYNIIKSIKICQDFITSDHVPISVAIDLGCARVDGDNRSSLKHPKITWSDLSENELIRYNQLTECNLKSVLLNHELLMCDDPNCSDVAHRCAIDRLYADITEALTASSHEFLEEH